ncbi:mitochondrial large subunit ribosomal protein-domain-containing protein [Spinellus fusiger]|nr:mitochondrial large subunit ribosomal protein-domain-containing protein [Spinellus fusiger]
MLGRLTLVTIGKRVYSSSSTATATAVKATTTTTPRPYFISRTSNKELPVYTEIRNGGTRQLTIIRRIEGDAEALKNEILTLYYQGIPYRGDQAVVKRTGILNYLAHNLYT